MQTNNPSTNFLRVLSGIIKDSVTSDSTSLKLSIKYLAIIGMLFNTVIYKAYAQQILPPAIPDTLFPLTNNYNWDSTSLELFAGSSSVFKILPNKGTYYLFGNFSNITTNHNSPFIMDTATGHINTSALWKINGEVRTAIPDGNGGFYLGGSFTKVGDSTRKYFAQVNRYGKPGGLKISCDSFINKLYKRNDTLFIAGAFTIIAGKTKQRLALYSLTADSILGKPNSPFVYMKEVKAFALDNDTLIAAGDGYFDTSYRFQTIKKFHVKADTVIRWRLGFQEWGPVSDIFLNKDNTGIIYCSHYNGTYIVGMNKLSGQQLYRIDPSYNRLPNFGYNGTGLVNGMQVVDNKVYVGGYFDRFQKNQTGGFYYKKGFMVLDAVSGSLLPDQIKFNGGYLRMLQYENGKLYLGGEFVAVNGVARQHFAVLDTGTYNVQPLDIAPTDPITSVCFSGGSLFAKGYFTGIHSFRRQHLAAFDSATSTILPWAPKLYANFEVGKRMLIHGDTMFVLGLTHAPYGCLTNYNSYIRMFRLSTGEEITGSLDLLYSPTDIHIDDNYIYIGYLTGINRYNISTLKRDQSWGHNFSGYGWEHTPFSILSTADSIYTVGDSRFVDQFLCTGFGPKRAWLISYSKNDGYPVNYVPYQDNDPNYNQPRFDQAILAGNKLFVYGSFERLNDSARKNIVCLDVHTGKVTGWKLQSANGDSLAFAYTAGIKYYNKKIWMGMTESSQAYINYLSSVDMSTGIVDTAALIRPGDSYFPELNLVKFPTVSDFLFSASDVIVVGNFDSVNHYSATNLVRYKIKTSAGTVFTFKGNGNWSNPANWQDGVVPPANLINGEQIFIDPPPGGQCVLDRLQYVSRGGAIIIMQGKKLLMPQNLVIQ